MNVFISIISHNHSELIKRLNSIEGLCRCFNVIVKSNTDRDDLSNLLDNENFSWVNEKYNKGFGENNNIVFSYCKNELNMKDDDFFIVLNPDVYIESSAITKLVKKMESEKVKLATINLYKDFNKGIYDSSIRSFPTFKQFVYSFVGLGNTSIIDKANIYTSLKVNWAAGSFLAFTSEHYRKLKGFDEQYFMYCEDIDICYRSYSNGNELTYYPDVDAVHLAKHQNRKIFSMHFYWHVSSVFRFLFKKSLSR